jgi:hypothetical protein
MPVLHRNLACDDGGPAAVTVLKDLEKVVTRSGVEGLQAPVVQ